MGVVYLAEDLLLKRTVALKVLYEHLNRDSSFVERFQKEARAVSSLHHPNIVFVHGMELVKNTFLIDMEYVDGLSLDQFTRNGPVPPIIAAGIAADILEGLLTCHEVGVIHRDIKPANILLNQSGVAKIADFGLATAYAGHLMDSVKSRVSSGFFMGTPRYAPPAAWDGLEPVPGWDLYSLGVMLFEMLSGQVAYPGETPMAIVRQHLTSPLPPVAEAAPGASPALAALVDGLVASNGSDNAFTTAGVLQALRDTPEYARARESETAKTVRAAIRSRRVNWGVAPARRWLSQGARAAALLALGGGACWLLLPPSPSTAPGPLPSASTPGIGDPLVFLRPESVGGGTGGDPMWMLSSEGDTARIVSLSDLELGYFSLTRAGGRERYTVTGGWAEYLSQAKSSFRYGEVRGEALLDREGNRLALTLKKINNRDQSASEVFLVARPQATNQDGAGFIRRLEANAAAQSLLHNELLPRALPWAGAVEALMPAFPRGRLAVPRADTAIAVDGHLREPVWVQSFATGPAETLQAGEPDATLSARWSDNALVLGFAAPAATPDARLRVVLDTGVKEPTGLARRFLVTLGPDGVLESLSRVGTREVPWTCDWDGASAIEGAQWQAELRIPVSSFGALGMPDGHRRWRLNAALLEGEPPVALAQWGHRDLDATEHGIALVFLEAQS